MGCVREMHAWWLAPERPGNQVAASCPAASKAGVLHRTPHALLSTRRCCAPVSRWRATADNTPQRHHRAPPCPGTRLHAADGRGADQHFVVGARVGDHLLCVLLGHALRDDRDHLDGRLPQGLHGRLKRAGGEGRKGRGARSGGKLLAWRWGGRGAGVRMIACPLTSCTRRPSLVEARAVARLHHGERMPACPIRCPPARQRRFLCDQHTHLRKDA